MSESATRLFHGSSTIVSRPVFGRGNPFNDYGLGFYCTEHRELASEWACSECRDGYVSEYVLPLQGLDIVDLDGEEYSVLNWLAVLLANRRFDVTTPVMARAKSFMLERYSVDLSKADVVCGYRADDSYFSFARAFLGNRISLRQLERAMKLGELGRQVVLKSRKAFSAIEFVDAHMAAGEEWHPRRVERDRRARSEYRKELESAEITDGDVFVIDLIRGM